MSNCWRSGSLLRVQVAPPEGNLIDINDRNGPDVIVPKRVITAESTPKLSRKEQNQLKSAGWKVEAVNPADSGGQTAEGVQVAANAGVFRPAHR